MKATRLISILLIVLFITSCVSKDSKSLKQASGQSSDAFSVNMPIDKGFSEFIAGYTSGTIPANSAIEIRFSPEFAAKADKSASGLFVFEPSVKGKTEWKDETTLVFTPSRLLDPGKTYTGGLNLYKLSNVKERLRVFPLRIQTLKKDFHVTTSSLECAPEGSSYLLHGQITTADFIEAGEAESYLTAKLGRKRMDITWDHSENLIHKFTIPAIERTAKPQELFLEWDGSSGGVNQNGTSTINIPAAGEFIVMDILAVPGENQRIDVLFSDPVDASQETEGLIQLSPVSASTTTISSNIISLFPTTPLQGKVDINVESSVRNNKGATLSSSFLKQLDFTSVAPAILLEGNGIILPASKNLIFPFKAANLKAVDLKIIKIFDNNLPYFLQDNDLNGGNSVKRFGRPVYYGKVELTTGAGINAGGWNLYTIDISDYIEVEPGVLYKVELSMRRSYSLYTCSGPVEPGKYEEALQQAEDKSREFWDDPDNYYENSEDEIYYDFGFDYDDRRNPCTDAYFSPDKRVTRNILASNIGLMAKKGEDDILHVMANDLLTALPVSQCTIDVYDLQMQLVTSGTTDQNGSVALFCERKPFLVIAKKDKDRNYLKTNEGSALSMSSFDVSGNKPENGIKAFIYGERDVWRPGDSIFLSLFIKDMKSDLPEGHPVQFELINPLEQRVDNQIQKPNGTNLLVFTTKTSADAITGDYKALFRIGGATFTKRVRIETVKPNRLKINLTFKGDILGGSNSVSKGSLNVKWLNGAVAKNLKASVEYLLKRTKTEFDKYGQYDFDDPITEFHSESVNIFEDEVDENGHAAVTFDPGTELNAPGMLNAVFTVKASEPGGDESITQAAYKYAPYPVFAGINVPGLKGKSRMLFTDADNEVKVVTVDENGKPLRSELEITIYKISYRWWWEADEENLAYYISNDNYKPVFRKKLTTSGGGEASFSFRIDKKDWGRYLIRATTPAGHSTGKILLVDWPWEYGAKGNSEGATLLAVNTDKEKYNPGDEIKLTFPAPENSRAIITLENSTGVIDEMRVSTEKGSTVVAFKAKPEMAPNVYAYVTVIQPHAQTINDMPMRLYGVIPVMVEDRETRLTPKIEMPDEIRSQKAVEIKVSEANKKSMTYTLAVVDEGLLDITGFRTPDPWKYFYAREALGVQTWDLYDFVLGAFGGTLERAFAIGGDEAVVDKTANKARRFIPVVKFLGPFTLGAGKTDTHTITLPQYTGSVRTMVIAGNDRAFGIAEKSVFVKDPLMLLVTAPRVVSPGEKVALPVTVFIQKNGIKDISVKAEGNDLVSFEQQTINIPVSGIGEKDSEFSFTAGGKTGVAKISVTATGGGETATYNMELEVRSPNPPEVRSEIKLIRKGEKFETTFKPFGIEGSNSAVMEVSSMPSINLEKRLEYLLDYPYGCSEQITSELFPQLWLSDLKPNDPNIAKRASANIIAGINMLVSRQMVNGGVALWPGSSQPDNWVTSYAGHFMTEAERKGYSIPSGFKNKWLSYQKKTAQDWRYDAKFKETANDQAYRLFSLALAGQPEKGAMNRLRESAGIPQLSKWLLSAAFATTGRPEVAGDLLDMRNLIIESEYHSYYYGSELRDKAIVLYTLTLLKKDDQAIPLLTDICSKFSNTEWYSTQSLAWGLFSYMKWVETLPGDKDSPSKLRITYNGAKSDQTLLSKQIWSKDLKVNNDNNTLTIENTSEKALYITLTRKGVPLISDALREEKGLSMKIDYLTLDLKPIDHKNLKQGTDFMMVAKVTNNTFSAIDNIALTEMVPSGWEIQNTRLFEADYGIKEGISDYRDFRDDRVYTFFSLSQGQSKTFVMILNAAYKGDFYQPSVWCEAMYTPNCYSRIPGNQVKVTGQKVE